LVTGWALQFNKVPEIVEMALAGIVIVPKEIFELVVEKACVYMGVPEHALKFEYTANTNCELPGIFPLA
jgi:hypothetical protein